MTTIARREDVNPERGIKEYGDVEFADPVNHKYPIDTDKHIRAAWSYIHHENDAARYSPDEVELIKSRIKQAAAAHGIAIESE